MYKQVARLMFSLILTGWVISANAGGLTPPCELPFIQSTCESTREAIKYPGDKGPEEYCPQSPGYYCLLKSLAVPPAPAWIHCQSLSAYQVSCSVWPRGDMTYNWATSGGLQVSGDSWGGDTRTVNCNDAFGSGIVSVQIFTTQGMSETVFSGVQCGSIEY